MNGKTQQNNSAIGQMIQTHPSQPWIDSQQLTQTLQSLNECAATCTACADACLGEEMVAELKQCIRLNLDCADICQTTSRVLTRLVQPNRQVIEALVQACAAVCQACGQECASHAQMHEHCRVCAEACRRCEEQCRQLL